MVNVVEQLEALRADAAAKFDAPGGAVAHIIGVVHARVQQLHHEGHTMFLGGGHEAAQAGCAVLQPLLVVEALAVTREAD
jgi:hypothetical protein